mgnify:CR=1 FL=1
MHQIIGLCGLQGAGKNTVYNIINENFQHVYHVSFGSGVKDVIAVMFKWPRNLLEGDTVESREWRETPDEFWSNKLGKPFTPRLAMQWFATDIVRNQLSSNFWVDYAEQSFKEIWDKDPEADIFITDVRFPNEINMIRKNGGQIWFVACGDLPVWFEDAKRYNQNKDMPLPKSLENVHQSERDWIGVTNPDVVIHPKVKGIDLLTKLVLEIYQGKRK